MHTTPETADIVIVGGGAAGLTAAIFAAQTLNAQPPAVARRILLLEGTRQLGTKILVSGGARCNVTHHAVSPDDFNGSRNIIRNVLASFGVAATVDFFASMGVELEEEPETGKLFPASNSARAIRDALATRCMDLGVFIRPDSKVTRILAPTEHERHFRLETPLGTLAASRIILATGGRSLPGSGSDGSGWTLARDLGHTVTPTYQALVPLMLDHAMFHEQVSGIATDVQLTTYVAGKPVDTRAGALLWTHFGISGPAAMDASRHWVIAHEAGQEVQMKCNFLPPDGFEATEKRLVAGIAQRPRLSILNLLSTRLPERLCAALLTHSGIDPATPAGQVSRDLRRTLVHNLTALPLPITGPRGWEYAEVTAGGIPLAEVNYRTMESRLVPGLHFAGEIMDCDGRIGGFNLQWAWATGHLAGQAAGKAL